MTPTCPRCFDLCRVDARWCDSCGWWLLSRGPTATEVRTRARLAEIRGVPGVTFLREAGRTRRPATEPREEG